MGGLAPFFPLTAGGKPGGGPIEVLKEAPAWPPTVAWVNRWETMSA